MEFSFRKPLHLLALLVLLFAFFLIIVVPILSFSGVFSTVGEATDISEIDILFGSIIIIIIFIIAPLIWYLLVNQYSIKQMFNALNLRKERIDEAFLWGIITAIVMFIMVIAIGYLLTATEVLSAEDASNVKDLAGNLSIFSMVFIIIFQSVAEEVFFRGFLLEKIDSFAGKNIAIIITALLFGLAHLSYGKLYPAIMPMFMGIFLGYVVLKTKNLYAAIIAHMLFNFASFAIYLFSKSLTG